MYIPRKKLDFIYNRLKKVDIAEVDGYQFDRFRKEEIEKANKGEMNIQRKYTHLIDKDDFVLCWLDGELAIKQVKRVEQKNYLLKIQIDTRKWIGKTKVIAKVKKI